MRELLNKLAAREIPFKVQRVEVAEDQPTPPPPLKPQYDEDGNLMVLGPADQPKTVAAALYSKFTVMVEYVELVSPSSDSNASK